MPPGWSRHDFADGKDRYAVFARTPSEVWAIGAIAGDQLWRWDGGAWQRIPLGTTAPAFTVWAASATDILTGGLDDAKRRGDGHSWTTWGSTESITGLWGTSSADVWAVGLQSSRGAPSPNVVMHYDGTSWSVSQAWPQPSSVVKDWSYNCTIHGSARDNVWDFKHAAERESPEIGPAELFRWDGVSWATNGRLPDDGHGHGYPNSGRLWVLSPTDVWVTYQDELLHFDGATWARVAIPGSFLAVWASGARDVVAAGQNGLIARYDGVAWSILATSVSSELFAVHGTAGDDVWVVGAHGVALHYGVAKH